MFITRIFCVITVRIWRPLPHWRKFIPEVQRKFCRIQYREHQEADGKYFASAITGVSSPVSGPGRPRRAGTRYNFLHLAGKCCYCGWKQLLLWLGEYTIYAEARHGRRPDMQLQKVQKETECSGLGHLLLTYPSPPNLLCSCVFTLFESFALTIFRHIL